MKNLSQFLIIFSLLIYSSLFFYISSIITLHIYHLAIISFNFYLVDFFNMSKQLNNLFTNYCELYIKDINKNDGVERDQDQVLALVSTNNQDFFINP